MTALSEFVSERCPVCDKHKRKGNSFCTPCYYSLPIEMRQALYRRFGEGYEQALAEAKEWLEKEREVLKQSCR
jgi:hypothetical protein